jgi:hypothetical protein
MKRALFYTTIAQLNLIIKANVITPIKFKVLISAA